MYKLFESDKINITSKKEARQFVDLDNMSSEHAVTLCCVLQAMEVSKYNKDSLIAEFGLKFNEKLAPVEGRMLPPPQVSKTN